MKYAQLIRSLDSDRLYTPALIANLAEENRTLVPGVEKRLEKNRVRLILGRFVDKNDFPREGDGKVTLLGQAPVPAWFGWRWKASLPN